MTAAGPGGWRSDRGNPGPGRVDRMRRARPGRGRRCRRPSRVVADRRRRRPPRCDLAPTAGRPRGHAEVGAQVGLAQSEGRHVGGGRGQVVGALEPEGGLDEQVDGTVRGRRRDVTHRVDGLGLGKAQSDGTGQPGDHRDVVVVPGGSRRVDADLERAGRALQGVGSRLPGRRACASATTASSRSTMTTSADEARALATRSGRSPGTYSQVSGGHGLTAGPPGPPRPPATSAATSSSAVAELAQDGRRVDSGRAPGEPGGRVALRHPEQRPLHGQLAEVVVGDGGWYRAPGSCGSSAMSSAV